MDTRKARDVRAALQKYERGEWDEPKRPMPPVLAITGIDIELLRTMGIRWEWEWENE